MNDQTWAKEQSGNLYESKLERVSCPVDEKKLKLFLKTTAKKLGLTIKLYERSFVSKANLERIHSEEEFNEFHGSDVKIVDKGKIWHKGWDIEDVFFIAKFKNVLEIHYSNNSHGFGVDTYVKKGNKKGLEQFIKFLTKDGDVAEKIAANGIKAQVLKSWK